MSSAVILEIMQSDNGNEFFRKFIHYIDEYFKVVNIVKCRPMRPNEQGSMEGIMVTSKSHVKVGGRIHG
jgi:phosphoribosylformimino-5-aminoimidazole carboxamide ribonucleotide (ProFAR) isomerase